MIILPVCDEGFIDSSSSQKHIKRHTGDKPYKCNICSKECSMSCSLQTHIRADTCDICGRGFRANWYMERHIRTHTGDNPM